MGFEAVDGSAWTVSVTSHQSLRLYAASRMMRSDSSSLRVGIRGPWLLVTHLRCDLQSLALSRFIDFQVFISDGPHGLPLLVIHKQLGILAISGQESTVAHLETILDGADSLNFLLGQLPAIKVEVGSNAAGAGGLGDDGVTSAQAPLQQNLLHRLALFLCKLRQSVVLVEWRVGRSQT